MLHKIHNNKKLLESLVAQQLPTKVATLKTSIQSADSAIKTLSKAKGQLEKDIVRAKEDALQQVDIVKSSVFKTRSDLSRDIEVTKSEFHNKNVSNEKVLTLQERKLKLLKTN